MCRYLNKAGVASVFVGPGSEVTIADESLALKSTYRPDEEETLLDSAIFPRQACTFAPSRTTAVSDSILVTVGQKDKAIRVRVLGVDEKGHARVLGECSVPLPAPQVCGQYL